MTIYSFDELAKGQPVKVVKSAATEKPVQSEQGFISGVKEDIGGRAVEAMKAGERFQKGEQTLPETVLQTGGQIVGGITDIITRGLGAITPEFIKEPLKAGVSAVAETEPVQKALTAYQGWAEQNPRAAKDLEAVINIATLYPAEKIAGILGKQSERGIIKGAKIVTKSAAQIGEKTAPIISGIESTLSAGKDIAQRGTKYISGMPERARTNLVEQSIQKAEIGKLSPIGQKAVENGINIRDVNLIQKATEPERALYRKMTTAAEKFSSDRSSLNPADIVGQEFRTRVKDLENVQSDIGKKLGVLAENIPNNKIGDTSNVVLLRMQKVPGLEGLKLNSKGELDFIDTTLSGSQTKGDRAVLQNSFRDIKNRNPFQLHKLRQELFEVLGGKKRALTQLTATQEGGLNAMRQGLSDALDAANLGYKKLNIEYAKASSPLQGVRKFFKNVLGADEDILDMTAGNLARRITSNAPSGIELTKLIREMEKSIGKAYPVSVENAQNFLNALNRYYDLAPDTALAGQVKLGMPTSLKGAAVKGLEQTLGIFGRTSAVQRKAFNDLLYKTGGL